MFASISDAVNSVSEGINVRAQEIVKSAADTFDEMTKIPPESTLGKLMELHTVLTATAAKMGVVVGQSEGGLGMYYLTHLRNSERNAHPDIGITEHAGLPQPPPERLAALHKYAPLVTYAYEETELALRAQLVPLGYDLVFFESEPSTERPAHYLCFHEEDKTVLLVVCGTKSVACAMTDAQIDEVPASLSNP